MSPSSALVLFESREHVEVLSDPVNQEWLSVVGAVDGARFEVLARRYYLALQHFRKSSSRPTLRERVTIFAEGKLAALQDILKLRKDRNGRGGEADQGEKAAMGPSAQQTFVDAHPKVADLPPALRDFSVLPPSLYNLCGGAGRPPCDALALTRAFLAAPLLGVDDSPTGVHQLLHSNPAFARACGFLGLRAVKRSAELTSRRTPSLAVCDEFNEVMTQYGLWQHARIEQVKDNLDAGVLEQDKMLVFDTTHVKANSHCANVIPADAKVVDGKKPKHCKVPRMRKLCACGTQRWETCEHAWTPTDQGAAVVVKGPTRIYWAHKQSVVSLGASEIPIDVRVLQYAAENDGKTLMPHLEIIQQDLPKFLDAVQFIAADDAYHQNRGAVERFGAPARFIGPAHSSNKSKVVLAAQFSGIDRFTPTGVPVCKGHHRFDMVGRDISREQYIWAAPLDEQGRSACLSCPLAQTCLKGGTRRHIRVARSEFPNIAWDHPQHLATNRAHYKKRTGVERAIKCLKVDLGGERLTHRDAHRVQAHFDRKLLTLHLLLAASTP
jgi:Transposase DDE domain